MTLILIRVLVKIMRRAAEGERSAPPQRFFVQNALPPAIFHVECFSLRLLNVCTRQSLWYNNAQSGRRRAISAALAIFRVECAASSNFSCGTLFFATFECLHTPESWVQKCAERPKASDQRRLGDFSCGMCCLRRFFMRNEFFM